MRGGKMEKVAAVEEDVELKQGGEKEEIRVAGDSQPQHAILPDELALSPQIRQEIEFEFSRRIGGGNFADAQAGDQPNVPAAQKDEAGELLAPRQRVV